MLTGRSKISFQMTASLSDFLFLIISRTADFLTFAIGAIIGGLMPSDGGEGFFAAFRFLYSSAVSRSIEKVDSFDTVSFSESGIGGGGFFLRRKVKKSPAKKEEVHFFLYRGDEGVAVGWDFTDFLVLLLK